MLCKPNSYSYRTRFDNEIIIDQTINKGEQRLRYNIKEWKIKGDLYILNNTSEHVTLFQLRGKVVNVNHAVIIDGN